MAAAKCPILIEERHLTSNCQPGRQKNLQRSRCLLIRGWLGPARQGNAKIVRLRGKTCLCSEVCLHSKICLPGNAGKTRLSAEPKGLTRNISCEAKGPVRKRSGFCAAKNPQGRSKPPTRPRARKEKQIPCGQSPRGKSHLIVNKGCAPGKPINTL